MVASSKLLIDVLVGVEWWAWRCFGFFGESHIVKGRQAKNLTGLDRCVRRVEYRSILQFVELGR